VLCLYSILSLAYSCNGIVEMDVQVYRSNSICPAFRQMKGLLFALEHLLAPYFNAFVNFPV
jgi:hypothetical protein